MRESKIEIAFQHSVHSAGCPCVCARECAMMMMMCGGHIPCVHNEKLQENQEIVINKTNICRPSPHKGSQPASHLAIGQIILCASFLCGVVCCVFVSFSRCLTFSTHTQSLLLPFSPSRRKYY